ncbi:bla regulator protein BlaR1 [Paenibacillus sp. DS2015]|uniref:M56 family metallopeptidase n=1 Tax=Paenibacillus sp. DS2015 TaxID=3373917 RepID=UPI003D2471C0
MTILCNVFLWFCNSTLMAGAVALLVMLVQKLFNRHLNPRIRQMLWLIVILRLLLPVLPSSSMSVFNAVDWIGGMQNSASTLMKPEISQITTDIPSWREGNQELSPAELNLNRQSSEVREVYTGSTTEPEKVNYPLYFQVAAVVWIIGVSVVLLYLVAYQIVMRRTFRSYQRVTDKQIVAALDDCRRQFGIQRSIPLYTGRYARSPYIAGLIRPWIYIPEGMDKHLNETQLYHIFAHELAHYKRRDVVWNFIGSLLLAVHWMNPVVWMTVKQMKADRELACDACVLETLGEAEALSYGMTMITLVKHSSVRRDQPHLLYFYGHDPKRQIIRRITMIKSFRKGSYRLSLIAVVCLALISAVTLTNAKSDVPSPTAKTESNSFWSPTGRVLFDSTFWTYDNMSKAVDVANFKFKVPGNLPSGFTFEEVNLLPAGTVQEQGQGHTGDQVRMTFTAWTGINSSFGSFIIKAYQDGKGLEEAAADIEAWENQGKTEDSSVHIQKESLRLQGHDAIKLTLTYSRNEERYYYLWLDEGVRYQIEEHFTLNDKALQDVMASMTYPDQRLLDRDVNHDHMMMANIYDTGDIELAKESIGFTPKFPQLIPGSFKASKAYVTLKLNFSYPKDDTDYRRRLLAIQYDREESSTSGIQGVEFSQIKDKGIYDEMKSGNQADFYQVFDRNSAKSSRPMRVEEVRNGFGEVTYIQVEGQKNTVKLSPVMIDGQEALRTESYTIGGSFSMPNDSDNVSYFWKENDVCYQAVLQGEGQYTQEAEIVAYLMKEGPVSINDLQ